jgi:valyl-tRNA synthetase
MDGKFLKPYDPKGTEPRIYKEWEESGYFNPDNLPAADKGPFTIVMPPPNANGSLHAGHAVFVAIEDLITRFRRMQGYTALWLPGADHAGFETQVVYEKKLEKEGRSRFGMEPDALRAEIMDFTLHNKSFMEGQLRSLGASCDWSREKFTLDPDIVKTVYGTFKKLHEDGLVYRGKRTVNWCPKHQTSLSELETESVEEKTPFYYFKYGPFTIGTVRPETKFGDKYVVMHPDDKRYAEYKHGDTMEVEWINGPITATVIKDESVDPAFGTGVMTITPWHSQVDFEIAKRHNLDYEQIIDWRGKLLPIAGEFAGMKIAEARPKIVEKLAAKGLLVKTDDEYKNVVKRCYKCNSMIEPQVKDQWFLKMQPLAAPVIEKIEKDEVVFYPEHYKKIMLHWLTNIEDWNVSRQIVWGIPIPAWYCLKCGTPKIGGKALSRWFLVRHGETELNAENRFQGHADSPLTEKGVAQVEGAAKRLAAMDIGLIVSSDLGRAKETAAIIAKATGAEVRYEEGFRERNYGSLEKMSHAEFAEKHGSTNVLRAYDTRTADEETYKELEERIWKTFSEHRKEHTGKNVVLVGHGTAMRAFVKKLRDLSHEHAFTRPPVENAEIIGFDILEEPCANCGHDLFEQETDTFDTWFSSGQWPFATLGYPDGKDFKRFYPTQVMETAGEIIFFWVARMLMLGLYRTGSLPFTTVYLHGLVVAKDGQKMSKSKGNVISPLELSDKYGTDALRMGLIIGNTPGTTTALYEEKIKAYKLFANKLWNIARFVFENGEDVNPEAPLTDADAALIEEVNGLAADVTQDLENYRFYIAGEKLYHYAWHRLADAILEESKPILKGEDAAAKASRQAALFLILETTLRLLHPFMPFVTEEIWKSMPKKHENLLMVAKWPQ